MDHKTILIIIATFLISLSPSAHAEQKTPKIPPARAFKWDIGPANSSITQEFIVDEYAIYGIKLGFGGLDATEKDGYIRKNSDQSWRTQLGESPTYDGPLTKLMGKGSIYLGDVDSYTVQSERTGVIVPIHIQLVKLNSPFAETHRILDRIVYTAGIDSGGYLLTRAILHGFGMPLKPGAYRLSATTLRDTPVLTGIGTYLVITAPAKVSPPEDTKPKTVAEVIKKIKYILDHHHLVDDHFYTEENLINYFGAQRVQLDRSNPSNISAALEGFDLMAKQVHVGNFDLPGLTINISKNIEQDSRKTTGKISLVIRDAGADSVDFQNIEKIFGSNWTLRSDPQPDGKIHRNPVNKHGNERIEYGHTDLVSKQSILMDFSESADLATGIFIEEKRW